MTKNARTLPALLVAALLALVAVGCGVESKSDAGGETPTTEATPTTDDETTTTVEEDETTTTEDEETTTTEEEDDTTTTTEADDTTIPSIPDGFEDQFRDQLEIGFKSAGLDDTQAACLADAYVTEFGTDASQSTDFQAMLDLFTGCGIDPTDLGAG